MGGSKNEKEDAACEDWARAETVASLSIADDTRRTRESMQVAAAVKTLFAHLLHLLRALIQSLPETLAAAAPIASQRGDAAVAAAEA